MNRNNEDKHGDVDRDETWRDAQLHNEDDYLNVPLWYVQFIDHDQQ